MAFHVWEIREATAHRVTDAHQPLFGCRKGLIPRWVQRKYANKPVRGGDDFQWSLSTGDIRAFLREAHQAENGAVAIWANPKDEKKISWYRITGIAGESASGRTVMLVLLHEWATEHRRTPAAETRIALPVKPVVIVTFWYANGTFTPDGRIESKWGAPRPSSTNSVFIWPQTMSFFRRTFPEAFPMGKEA